MCLRCRSALTPSAGSPSVPFRSGTTRSRGRCRWSKEPTSPGSSPPGCSSGGYGYPRVSFGPLLSADHGSTELLDTPEQWVGRSVAEVVGFRTGLVRGTSPIRVTDAEKPIPLLEELQLLGLSSESVESETRFHVPRAATSRSPIRPRPSVPRPRSSTCDWMFAGSTRTGPSLLRHGSERPGPRSPSSTHEASGQPDPEATARSFIRYPNPMPDADIWQVGLGPR